MKGLLVVSISLFAADLLFAMSASTPSNRVYAATFVTAPECHGSSDPHISERCCWQQWDSDGAGNISNEKYKCCDYFKDGARTCYTSDSPIDRSPAGSGTVPTNVAPSKTKTCPDGSVINADDKCPPVTQGSTDQGTTTQPPTADNNNNNPKHHKGGELSQLSPLTGDNNDSNNNNDNKPSKHHKGSDTLTPPPVTDQGTQ